MSVGIFATEEGLENKNSVLQLKANSALQVNFPLLSLQGRRILLGRALGSKRSITEVFLRDGSKESLGFGSLGQTA